LSKILVSKSIPSWVNRTANLTSYIPFINTKMSKEEILEEKKKEYFNKTECKKIEDEKINKTVNVESSFVLNSKSELKDFLNGKSSLESDTDEQMIISLNFKKKVSISKIKISTTKDSKKIN
jgi:hypothetical protein